MTYEEARQSHPTVVYEFLSQFCKTVTEERWAANSAYIISRECTDEKEALEQWVAWTKDES